VVRGGSGCKSAAYHDVRHSWLHAGPQLSNSDRNRYNYPAVTNNLTLRPPLYIRLAAHPNIIGAKLSHGDISLLAQITNSDSPHTKPDVFRVFTGLGQQLVPVLSVNGAGAIDGLAGIFPHVVVRLYEVYHQAANTESEHSANLKVVMGELQGDVSRGEELVVKWGTVGIKDAIARELSFGTTGATRLPLAGGMPDSAWGEYAEAFEKLRRTEKMLAQHRSNVEGRE
jgi:2-keto-3-deoxy-L-rhamnonate aldolase